MGTLFKQFRMHFTDLTCKCYLLSIIIFQFQVDGFGLWWEVAVFWGTTVSRMWARISPCLLIAFGAQVQYRRYHRINMSDFHSDLRNTSFLKSPDDAVGDLYEQYVHDLSNLLDRHAPLISRLTKKDSADWMSDDYRRAKTLRCQFEVTWHRAKNPLNRSLLCHQITRCNALVNKDKSDYYSKLISNNSHDIGKLENYGVNCIKP